ncbi:hypothetical protein [Salinihabitans flavidus]|uniref:hypothetical protein n=1 Tax=Salinihabitans flavidus TaxID=569882 RepID=UPI001C312DE3|nr:hypothetical protein [Salinihabitans flavidus]
MALTRAGRLIPNLVLRKKLGVTTLQDQARFANEFETKFGAFVRDRPSGLFVISGEPMYNLLDKPDLIRTLDGFFAEYFPQRSYLVYLRDPVDWVASQYSQSISSGQDINLRTLIDQVARRDQFAQIAAWDDLLPECGMQVRLLEPDTLHGGGLLSDLCHVMGCNLDGLHVSRDRKLGLARHEIALLRYANRLGKNDLGWRLLRQTRRFRFSGRRGSFKLPRHHRDAVRAMFASSIERIRARYFPNRTSLFGDKSTPAHTLKDATP